MRLQSMTPPRKMKEPASPDTIAPPRFLVASKAGRILMKWEMPGKMK